MTSTSKFNEILDQIDGLSYEDQEMLIDILKKRLIENRRNEIADNIKKSHQEYKSRNVVRGSVKNIINELNN